MSAKNAAGDPAYGFYVHDWSHEICDGGFSVVGTILLANN